MNPGLLGASPSPLSLRLVNDLINTTANKLKYSRLLGMPKNVTYLIKLQQL